MVPHCARTFEGGGPGAVMSGLTCNDMIPVNDKGGSIMLDVPPHWQGRNGQTRKGDIDDCT